VKDGKLPTHGVRSLSIGGLSIDGLEVERDCIIGQTGRGFETVLRSLQVTRTMCAWLALGVAQTALEIAVAFAKRRVLYGELLWNIPYVRSTLVDAYTDILLCESVSIRATQVLQNAPEQAALYSSCLKVFVPECLHDTVNRLCKLVGARSYLRASSPLSMLEKCKRDIALIPLFDGSTHANCYNVVLAMRILARTQKLPDSQMLESLRQQCKLAPDAALGDLTRLGMDYPIVDHVAALTKIAISDDQKAVRPQHCEKIAEHRDRHALLETNATTANAVIKTISRQAGNTGTGPTALTRAVMSSATQYIECFALANAAALVAVNEEEMDQSDHAWLDYVLEKRVCLDKTRFADDVGDLTERLAYELEARFEQSKMFSLFDFELSDRMYNSIEGI
jgi:hypothetical protein